MSQVLCQACGERPVIPPVLSCWFCRQKPADRRRRYGAWHRTQIIETYKATSSTAKAAAAAGTSASYAWHILDDEGLITNRTPEYPAEVVEEALRLYIDERLSCRGVEARLREKHSPAPSQESIHQWVKAHGLLRTKSQADVIQNSRRNGRDYEGEVGPRAQELATRKLSVRRIARELGVSRQAVKRHLSEEDRPGPAMATIRQAWEADTPEARARRARRDQVVVMRHDGATYPEIEEESGLSTATVYLYLKGAGLVADEDLPEDVRAVVRQLAGLRKVIRRHSKEARG